MWPVSPRLKIGNTPEFLLNTFASYTHRHPGDRRDLNHRFASASIWTVPFATSQNRTNELASAVIAMDAITPMEGHGELAIPPAFVNVVCNCLRYASPAWQTSQIGGRSLLNWMRSNQRRNAT
jgi:hypothetical protein